MSRAITDEVLRHLKQWEGCVLYAYDDEDGSNPRRFIQPGDPVRGTLTIGYGHTESVTPGMRITQSEAEHLFEMDIAARVPALEAMIKVPVTDTQFGVLLSWAYNVGLGNARKSTLISKLNAGNYDAVPGELAKWNRAAGKVNRGLVNRRAAEAGLWARGDFVASTSVRPAAPVTAPTPVLDAGLIGSAGAAAPAVAAVVSSFSAVPWPVALILVGAAVGAGAFFLLRRQRQAIS